MLITCDFWFEWSDSRELIMLNQREWGLYLRSYSMEFINIFFFWLFKFKNIFLIFLEIVCLRTSVEDYYFFLFFSRLTENVKITVITLTFSFFNILTWKFKAMNIINFNVMFWQFIIIFFFEGVYKNFNKLISWRWECKFFTQTIMFKTGAKNWLK